MGPRPLIKRATARWGSAIAKIYFPPADLEAPRRSPIGLLVTALTINLLIALGVWVVSLLSIPYLPSFVWGSVEIARLMATGSPATPQTELGRWYARYQDAQDASLERLTGVSDPLPLDSLANSTLFREASERDSLRPDLGAYVEALHTWDEASQKTLDTALTELDRLAIPPGSAELVKSVIGPLEGEWIDRQSAWAAAESSWVTAVVDLYDWMEIAERRGAERLNGEELLWLNARDQQGYDSRLQKVRMQDWMAAGAQTELNDWTAAQTPLGLWQIFVNWARGYGLVPPPAPTQPELLA